MRPELLVSIRIGSELFERGFESSPQESYTEDFSDCEGDRLPLVRSQSTPRGQNGEKNLILRTYPTIDFDVLSAWAVRIGKG